MRIEKWEIPKMELKNFCIYNRFDLRFENNNVFFRITNKDVDYCLPVHIVDKEALMGLWLNPIPAPFVEKACDVLFAEYSIEKIHFEYYPALIEKNCNNRKSNHWQVDLPSSSEELDGRLSRKKRYNIRREKNIAQKDLGSFKINEYESDQVPDTIIHTYFEFKNASHQSEYHMTPAEYLRQYYVSHVYTLEFENEIGAILLACEQGDAVYLENLTYNPQYRKYSLGSILYDEYLKILIQKGKKQLFLGSGHQEYKSYYGAIEQTVYNGTVYRSRMRFWKEVTLPNEIKRMIFCIRKLGSKVKRTINFKARVRKTGQYLKEWLRLTKYDLKHTHFDEQIEAFRNKTKVMICAHPDDETLFFYDVLRNDPSILVICLSNASNPIRSTEFYNAMQAYGTDGIILNMRDSDTFQHNWKEEKLVNILQQIRAIISPQIIYTHNESGEYGHPHHTAVNNAVKAVFCDSEIWVTQRIQAILCEAPFEKESFCKSVYPSQNICEWFPQYIKFEGIEKNV